MNEQMREEIDKERISFNVHILLLGRWVCARMSEWMCMYLSIYPNATISLIENEINAGFTHKYQHTYSVMRLYVFVAESPMGNTHTVSSMDSLY